MVGQSAKFSSSSDNDWRVEITGMKNLGCLGHSVRKHGGFDPLVTFPGPQVLSC